MTLKEFGHYYSGKVFVTVLGYYSNGEYYSFYSGTDEPVHMKELEGSYLLDLQVKSMYIGWDGQTLWVDVVKIIGNKPEDGS